MNSSAQELAIVGASLYICEGTKERTTKRKNKTCKVYAVEFTNNDPRLIRVFLKFLREIISAEEEKIKAQLFLYPDHNQTQLLEFWSRVTNIPLTRFHKTILLQQKNLRYKPCIQGTLKIRYFHKEHFLKIQGIIRQVFGEVA